MSAKKYRILTFNWHEPYICMLAETGHQLFVFEPLITPGNHRQWDVRMRPIPENVTLITASEMERKLKESGFDLIICNNIKDIIAVSIWKETPKILVFHNKLTTEIELGGSVVDRNEYLGQIKPMLDGVHLVFISQSKKDDWGLDGEVILPGVDTEYYGGYTGDLKTILAVGNRIRERNIMMGFDEQQEICVEFPTTLLGDNPTLESRLSDSWEDLKKHYRHCRVYLNTTKHPYEDGYNLALLEAMATGMPIVSLANPTAPITDGVDGFISDDIKTLRQAVRELLNDQEKAQRMGSSAREKVREMFPIENFKEDWILVIDNAARSSKTYRRAEVSVKPANVWLDYVYNPCTTGHYLKRAFAKKHKLLTSGASLTPEVIKLWDLANMKGEVHDQDVPRHKATDAASIMSQMPKNFSPDFFLWVETGLDGPPPGLSQLSIPKAAYFIDTHLNMDSHLKAAPMFDLVFLAQKEYIKTFREKGIKEVHWLPLACDPEIHGRKDIPQINDIGFAGSITPSHVRRKQLLERLAVYFNLKIERAFLEDMATLFSASRIVFNNAIKNDLNMRIFEALCSGSMLLTDDAVGLADFFEDRRHLVIYKDENIVELARHYLTEKAEREEIAREGRKLVLAEHTYEHRVKQIVKTMQMQKETIRIEPEKPGQYYSQARPEVIEMVPQSAKRILEIGCAAGEMGRLLKEMDPEREVIGLELDPASAEKAAKVLDRVYCGEAEAINLPYPHGYFDCIIYADVLEHTYDPEKIIKKHKRLLAPAGVMVMSIPNTRHFTVVNDLIEGSWTYSDAGLLDRTHIRFFTLKEIKNMLKRCGMAPMEIKGKRADDMYREGFSGTLRLGRWQVDNLSQEEMFEFFVFQYLITAGRDMEQGEIKSDPAEPSRFREMIKASALFDEESGDKFVMAGRELASGEDTAAVKFVNGLEESEPERLLWVGHFNMTLSRFDQAEAIYRKLGNHKFTGCALAAQGFIFDALKEWWKTREDDEAMEWFERFSTGDSHPDVTALLPVEQGNGIRLCAGDTKEEIKERLKCDYVTSLHRLEGEGDIVRKLVEWRERLAEGGMLALVCTHESVDLREVHPTPMHRFTREGLLKIIGLVGGFAEITVREILEKKSFLIVLQKEPAGKFDYDAGMKNVQSAGVMEKCSYYWAKDMIEASAQCARAALAINPQNGAALAKLGDCLQKQNNPAAAIEYYRKAIPLSDNESPYIGMGAINLAKQNFKEASSYFEKAVEINPENDRALCGLGMARYHSGKKEEGFGLYNRALEINPENVAALTAILQASYELKNLKVAEKALKAYLELHPANMDILFGLAGVLYEQKKMSEARDTLDRILLFQPDHPNARTLYEKLTEADLQIK